MLRGLRRTAVIVIVASLTITAIVGIAALLSGEWGDTQMRILGTTLLIAGFSITSLCHLAVVGRPVRIVGIVGVVVSLVALLLGVILIWVDWSVDAHSFLSEANRWFGVASIAAVSLAHASLLLLLAARRRAAVRVGLVVTLVAIALVAGLLMWPILLGRLPFDFDSYARWLGVVAIVDALGTIVVPIIAVFLREPAPGAPSTSVAAEPDPASLPDATSALDGRIAALSAETGLDRERLLWAALDAFERKRAQSEG